MSEPIHRAKQDIARIDADIRKLKAERARIHAFVDMYRRYAKGNGAADADAESVPRRRRFKKDAATDAAASYVQQLGRPLPLELIYRHLQAQGVQIGGSNPQQN